MINDKCKVIHTRLDYFSDYGILYGVRATTFNKCEGKTIRKSGVRGSIKARASKPQRVEVQYLEAGMRLIKKDSTLNYAELVQNWWFPLWKATGNAIYSSINVS